MICFGNLMIGIWVLFTHNIIYFQRCSPKDIASLYLRGRREIASLSCDLFFWILFYKCRFSKTLQIKL